MNHGDSWPLRNQMLNIQLYGQERGKDTLQEEYQPDPT